MSLLRRKRSMDMLAAGLAFVIVLLCSALLWGLLFANQETDHASHSHARATASGPHRQESIEFKGTSENNAGTTFRALRRRSMGE